MIKGNLVQSDPHLNLSALQEQFKRPVLLFNNWQKDTILATSYPVGNDQLPVGVTEWNKNIYGLGVGIWMVSEI